jgi:hypothetical protein
MNSLFRTLSYCIIFIIALYFFTGSTLSIKQKNNFPEEIIPSKYDCLSNVWNDQDRYAASVPDKYKSSIRDLVKYLCKKTTNDMEKARVIYTWIALNISYDDNSFNTGHYRDPSPESVFKSKEAVCEGYSSLFEYMGKQAGLDAVSVIGYGKGIGYHKGDKFSATNHAWNAININGQWRLFDVTWASGYGTGVNGKLVTRKRFNGFWFDTDPEAFIFSHLPEDSKWQLNTHTLTKKEFENFPFVEDGYFEMGFDGKTCFQNAINGSLTEFPTAYGVDVLIHVVSLPYQKKITRNKDLKIKVTAIKACDIIIFNNNAATHLTKSGNDFSAIIHPHSGKLTLDVKTDPGSSMYSTMLEYIVK